MLLLSLTLCFLHPSTNQPFSIQEKDSESAAVQPPRLVVTDIIVKYDEHDTVVSLDFRIHNQGDKNISISRVRFVAGEVWDIRMKGVPAVNPYRHSLLPISGKYVLFISQLTQNGDWTEQAVAHVLGKDEVDRFEIKLTAGGIPYNARRSWFLKPILSTSHGKVEAPIVLVTLVSNPKLKAR